RRSRGFYESGKETGAETERENAHVSYPGTGAAGRVGRRAREARGGGRQRHRGASSLRGCGPVRRTALGKTSGPAQSGENPGYLKGRNASYARYRGRIL